VKRLRVKLAESWREAVTSNDVRLAAAVAGAMDERLGRETADALASEARVLIRKSILALEASTRADPREYLGKVPLDLMERFGVPEQVDLKRIVDWARGRAESLQGEAIPLPHPYDLHLFILRLQRLLDRRR
jgi:hypothetical protein